MKILVFSEDAIKSFRSDSKYAIISIQDPDCDFINLYKPKNCVAIKKFKFYDLDEKTGQPQYDIFLFDKFEAKYILEFYESIKDKIDILCINCVAGISRSAGVASALSKIQSGDDSYYFKHYCPNMRVYRTILNTYYDEKEKR